MSQTVFIVDDNDAMRDSLTQLLESVGLRVESHASGEAFLAHCQMDEPGCLILDMAMPGLSGLEVQAELVRRGLDLPILFLTGHGDIPMAVKALKAGATDFLEKPIQGNDLLRRVQHALALDAERRQARAAAQDLQARLDRLSPREQEVMSLVVGGLSSKEIARNLGLSHRTVDVHRTHIMQKMGAANLAELVKLAAQGNALAQSAPLE